MENKINELLSAMKLGDLVHKKEPESNKKNILLWILAVIGAVATVAGIAYAVYRYMNPDYLEDFDDDFDDYEDESEDAAEEPSSDTSEL